MTETAAAPQALPQLISYSLYRWENNIRAASILGVVGAGGLGQMLHFHLSLFQMREAASVILAMLAIVVVQVAMLAVIFGYGYVPETNGFHIDQISVSPIE